MTYAHSDYLKYTIPDGWIAEEEDDILTIYSPDGEGAMTLSFYSLVDYSQDVVNHISTMASRFVEQNDIVLNGAMRVHVSKENKAVLHGEGKTSDGWYTKLWILAQKPKIILATYDVQEKNDEIFICDAIIDSMTFDL